LLILTAVIAVRLAAAKADEPAADAKSNTASQSMSALKAADALYDGIISEKLPNGLRVFLKPVPSSPVVTTMVAYKVGSSDEDLDNTGLSHYLEHLMFKGTDKLKPGDIDHRTLTNGGANNAYTTENFTIFHFDLAADRWEFALEIEADRMQNLKIDEAHEFQQEKGAVISELKRDEDEPWDLEQKKILPVLFGPTAPYGHPVIGQQKHVEAATAQIIKAHYDKWYHPNNAALVICGGFDPERAMARVKELFGPIPAAKLPPRKPNVPISRDKPARIDFRSKFDVARMLMGFNTVDINDPDLPVLEVIQGVLSGGKTSRLYKKLVEGTEIAASADAFDTWGRYPGWFGVQMELLPGKDRAEGEKLVLAELQKVADDPVPPEELQRVKQGIVAGAVFDRESVHQLADNISQAVTVKDVAWLRGLLPRIAAVTPADIQRVAKKYLDPQTRVVVWSVPGEGEAAAAGDARSTGGKSQRAVHRHHRDDSVTSVTAAGAPSKEFSLKDTKRVELPNGMILLLWENHRLPIVVSSVHVGQVALREPKEQAGLAALMGGLLDEGTTKHSDQEIAELIENVGGSLALSSAGGTVKTLAQDRSLGLRLLLECLHDANFPNDAFEREKTHQLASIDDAQKQPMERATIAFRKAAYGKHPFGYPSLGTHTTVSKLTPADCRKFYKELFVPNNMVMAVTGDFNSDEVIAEIKKLTADWEKAPLADFTPPDVDKPKEFTEQIITMPDAVQLQFMMGHVGVRRSNPDYYKLMVMDYVLGTSPGFTDRLSSRLRDREGLAYTVTANITSSATEEPGLLTCYIGTDPGNLAKVKREFLEELNRIRTAPAPKDSEVSDAKQYLIGQIPFEYTTNEQVCGRLLSIERYQLGFDYLNTFKQKISAVTPADVMAVARKYVDPEHMVLVVAGAVDATGKALENADGK
jgi:zinc protease